MLQDYSGDNCIQYRVGGDEFIILYFKCDEESLQSQIKIMKDKLKEAGYSCAFGYALKKVYDNLLEVVKIADGLMYKDKALMKEEMLKNGEILHTRD